MLGGFILLQTISAPATLAVPIKVSSRLEGKSSLIITNSMDEARRIVHQELTKRVVFHDFRKSADTVDLFSLLDLASPYPYDILEDIFRTLLLEDLSHHSNIQFSDVMSYTNHIFKFLTAYCPPTSFASGFLFTMFTNKHQKALDMLNQMDAAQHHADHTNLLNDYLLDTPAIRYVQQFVNKLEQDYLQHNIQANPQNWFDEPTTHVIILGNTTPCFAERVLIEYIALLMQHGAYSDEIQVTLHDYSSYRSLLTDEVFLFGEEHGLIVKKMQLGRLI